MKGDKGNATSNSSSKLRNDSNDASVGLKDHVNVNSNPIEEGSNEETDLHNDIGHKPSFVSLFRGNRLPTQDFELKEVPYNGGNVVAMPNEIAKVEDAYGFCLLGCLLGGKISTFHLKKMVKNWGDNVTFRRHKFGWITFKFPTAEKRDEILHGGPYIVFGRQLYLKLRPSCFLFREEDMFYIPTWVQIHGLPSDCWTNVFLSKLASVIGKPLYMDRVTYLRTNENFARVLVELNITAERRREVGVELPTGITIQASFVYEGEPKFCEICQMMGHATLHCKREEIRKGKMKVDDMDQSTNEEPTPVDIPHDPTRDKTTAVGKKSRSRSRSRKRSVSRNRASSSNINVEEICTNVANKSSDVIDKVVVGLDKLQDTTTVKHLGKKEAQFVKDGRLQGNTTEKSASLNEEYTAFEDDFQVVGKKGKVVKKKNVQQNLVIEPNSPSKTSKTVEKKIEDCDKMPGQSSCNTGNVVQEVMINKQQNLHTKTGGLDGTTNKEKTQQVGKQGKTPKKKNTAKIPTKKNEAESSSCDTDYVAVDPNTGLPILNGKSITKKQIELARRMASASNH